MAAERAGPDAPDSESLAKVRLLLLEPHLLARDVEQPPHAERRIDEEAAHFLGRVLVAPIESMQTSAKHLVRTWRKRDRDQTRDSDYLCSRPTLSNLQESNQQRPTRPRPTSIPIGPPVRNPLYPREERGGERWTVLSSPCGSGRRRTVNIGPMFLLQQPNHDRTV